MNRIELNHFLAVFSGFFKLFRVSVTFRLAGTLTTHIESLRNRHQSDTICPRCSSNLVERIAKKGPNIGSTFLGCTAYPRCRFVKQMGVKLNSN